MIKTLYLAHPFGDRIRIGEDELRIERETGLDLTNPFYGVEGREDVRQFDKMMAEKGITRNDGEDRKEWIETWGVKRESRTQEVVERDLKAIRDADGILAFFTNKISIGTPMECFYCVHELKKPLFVIIEDETKWTHPWLNYFATRKFNSVDQFITEWQNLGPTKL